MNKKKLTALAVAITRSAFILCFIFIGFVAVEVAATFWGQWLKLAVLVAVAVVLVGYQYRDVLEETGRGRENN